MSKTIQQLVTENISLKKTIALSKIAVQRTEYEYAFLKQSYQELNSRYESCKKQYDSLNGNYRNIQRKSIDDTRYLEQRISELKDLVETKQREIEEIQLKILPTLDQDMIKVKIIRQIEEPYQDIIQKKDNQLDQLKKVIYENEKKLALLKLQLDDDRLNYQRQMDQLRLYHLGQIKTVNGSLNQIVEWNESKEKDKQTIKHLKKSLQESRRENELTKDQIQDIRRQNDSIRLQRNELLIKMTSVQNMKNGNLVKLQLQKIQNNEKIKAKDYELQKLNTQINKFKTDNKGLKQRNNDLEQQQNKLLQQIKQIKLQHISSCKQLQKQRHTIEQLQLRLSSKQQINKQLQRQQNIRFNELVEIQKRIKHTSQIVENKEYNYKKQMEEFNNEAREKLNEKIERYEQKIKELKDENYRLSRIYEEENRKDNIGNKQLVVQLEMKNVELETKLKQASATIVKLLKEKINTKQKNKSFKRRTSPLRESPVKYLNQRQEEMNQSQEFDAALVPIIPLPAPYPPIGFPVLSPPLNTRNIYIPTRY